MNHKRDFKAVIHKLSLWREETMIQLRDPITHAEALTLKRQLDEAITALDLHQRFQIGPNARVTVLPNLQTMTPSCAYRIIEDNETDHREEWIELKVEGKRLELSPSDIIIEQM